MVSVKDPWNFLSSYQHFHTYYKEFQSGATLRYLQPGSCLIPEPKAKLDLCMTNIY